MNEYLNHFFFGIYPYIAISVFLLGSLARFEREQYTWKSDSSQLLKRGQLRWGSNLFHLGIIALFFTHLVGLLTPLAVFHAFGITVQMKQMMAIVGGLSLGLVCLGGLLILIHRRVTEPRIRANTKWTDWLTVLWILLTLLLGLATIPVSMQHGDGHTMLALMDWAKHLVLLQSDAPLYMLAVPAIYKLHMVVGMTLFMIFPFTRLVHAFSGFAAVGYVTRSWQLVRRK